MSCLAALMSSENAELRLPAIWDPAGWLGVELSPEAGSSFLSSPCAAGLKSCENAEPSLPTMWESAGWLGVELSPDGAGPKPDGPAEGDGPA